MFNSKRPEVDVTIVRLFVSRLIRSGPLGDDLLRRLDGASGATREECRKVAQIAGYQTVFRRLFGGRG
jgi:hypothetical protein